DQAGVVGRPVFDTVFRLRLLRPALVLAHVLTSKDRESTQEPELLTEGIAPPVARKRHADAAGFMQRRPLTRAIQLATRSRCAALEAAA
ncbi:hypothetical protein, partial [Burkholderia ubonensis]|uniref:hypothetical protein n=1 Tax=Burkholderia ubonensis TaxID=101571 RepID=UPI001E53D525